MSRISYFDIKWLSEDNGPGKRFVLFLQGCNLDCSWCHVPHSQEKESPLLYFDSLCKKCGRCVRACENNVHDIVDLVHNINRERCMKCGECMEFCSHSYARSSQGALVLPTKELEVEALFNNIRPELSLLKGIGGLTISGGEPLLQAEAVAGLAARCKKSGFHTAIETSGIVPLSAVKTVQRHVDTWLIGMRLTTGQNTKLNPRQKQQLKECLKYLTQKKAKIIVRIPAIPDNTATEQHLKEVQALLIQYQLTNIEILPHNPNSGHYYSVLGMKAEVVYNKQRADEAYEYTKRFFESASSFSFKVLSN